MRRNQSFASLRSYTNVTILREFIVEKLEDSMIRIAVSPFTGSTLYAVSTTIKVIEMTNRIWRSRYYFFPFRDGKLQKSMNRLSQLRGLQVQYKNERNNGSTIHSSQVQPETLEKYTLLEQLPNLIQSMFQTN